MNKLAIVHFQPIEKYPPVLNFINSIIVEKNITCKVYTLNVEDDNWFSAINCQIYRIGKSALHPILRYWGYLQFNLITFIKLVYFNPKIVVAYETYSILPVFFYKTLYSHSKIFIHYHEYTSIAEIENASIYFKFIHFFEKKIFLTCDFISHTNSDRLELFLLNNSRIEKSKTFVAPNLPPSNWYEFAKSNKEINFSGVIKIVHVGAIGLNSTYIKEMINWVVLQNGKYCIDFYTSNISEDAKKIFEKLQSKYVKLLDPINYYDLPKVLIKYDIGVTLYNGNIPNYVYNVPNKLFEYLSCGLNVWYSCDLISTRKFVELNNIKGCQEIDFTSINNHLLDTVNSFNKNVFFENTRNSLKEKVLSII
jgi:hypothetical protein